MGPEAIRRAARRGRRFAPRIRQTAARIQGPACLPFFLSKVIPLR